MNNQEFDKINVFGKGEPHLNYAKYFIGNSITYFDFFWIQYVFQFIYYFDFFRYNYNNQSYGYQYYSYYL